MTYQNSFHNTSDISRMLLLLFFPSSQDLQLDSYYYSMAACRWIWKAEPIKIVKTLLSMCTIDTGAELCWNVWNEQSSLGLTLKHLPIDFLTTSHCHLFSLYYLIIEIKVWIRVQFSFWENFMSLVFPFDWLWLEWGSKRRLTIWLL